jgi:hypothetical protein
MAGAQASAKEATKEYLAWQKEQADLHCLYRAVDAANAKKSREEEQETKRFNHEDKCAETKNAQDRAKVELHAARTEARRHRELDELRKLEDNEARAESRRLQLLDRGAIEEAARAEADTKRRLSIMHVARLNGDFI